MNSALNSIPAPGLPQGLWQIGATRWSFQLRSLWGGDLVNVCLSEFECLQTQNALGDLMVLSLTSHNGPLSERLSILRFTKKSRFAHNRAHYSNDSVITNMLYLPSEACDITEGRSFLDSLITSHIWCIWNCVWWRDILFLASAAIWPTTPIAAPKLIVPVYFGWQCCRDK
jgi:hypothetical protein